MAHVIFLTWKTLISLKQRECLSKCDRYEEEEKLRLMQSWIAVHYAVFETAVFYLSQGTDVSKDSPIT